MNDEIRNTLNNVRDKITQKTETNTVSLVNSIKLPKESITNDITSDNTFIRLVFEFNNSIKIIGGDGTISNPYLLKGGAISC